MKNSTLITIVILMGLVVLVYFLGVQPTLSPHEDEVSHQESPIVKNNQLISDGVISVPFQSSIFGLAVNKQQIQVKSYIPPCEENFNYCIYYIGKDYTGTNFESAGIRVQKRDDITSERLCLNTSPSGFTNVIPDQSTSTDVYSSSVFRNVGGAGAGHFANGSLYRLYVRNKNACYEFEERVGQTQFSNYPEGTIKEFTPALEQKVKTDLDQIIKNIYLPGGEKNLFP